MGSDDIVSRLIEGLEAAANSDASLRAAFVRQEAIDCIDQGLAVEGLIDLSPLRHHLLGKGAPKEAVVNAIGQLSAIAAAVGLTPSSPPSIPSPADPASAGASAQAPEPDGFIPGDEIRREKDKLDRALVSVVVRNADLNVDMEQFRDHLRSGLDAGRATGAVELEAVYDWLKSTGSTETACQETVLSLVSLAAQAKTKYQLGLPSALKALTEAQQKEILDAFNKRCPPEAQPAPQPRGPKPEEKKAATPAWVPEKPTAKKKKSAVGPLMAVTILLCAGGGFLLFGGEADYKPAGESLKLPPGAMPCTMLLRRGNGIFCGLKPAAWTSLSEAHGADVKDMKKKTIDAATSAGFVGVTFGLDTSR
ncbi:MAG TPA: hypothetical protein VL137_16960 [Polyangiaceae bacterium]|nr:hypothetical protein [Polyangiaceae bacterium]